ncbi:MAG: zf-HC2 domain-containing protein [Gaiella sp.]
MSQSSHSAVCTRSREWTSLRLDGELSSLERRMLDRHLGRCGDCRAFAASLTGVTELMRATEPEALARPVDVAPFRRSRQIRVTRVAMRSAAAAAMVVCAVAAGALLPFGGTDKRAAPTPGLLLVVAEDTEMPNEGEILRQERAASPSQADAVARGFREVL